MGGHNPYFNRWFSAIGNEAIINEFINMVTILILIDGFLQFKTADKVVIGHEVTILILIDGFLQLRQKGNVDNISGTSQSLF